MKQKAPEQTTPVSEDVLRQLAVELQRLAGSIKKDIKNKLTLKSLSNLSAITPVQQMLISQLSRTLFTNEPQNSQEESSSIPGYL